MERTPAVYVLASQKNGTLYIGVTSHRCNDGGNTGRAS